MRHSIWTLLSIVTLSSGPVSSSLSPSTVNLLGSIKACQNEVMQYCHSAHEAIDCLRCLKQECIDEIVPKISSFDPYDDILQPACSRVPQCADLFTTSSKEGERGGTVAVFPEL